MSDVPFNFPTASAMPRIELQSIPGQVLRLRRVRLRSGFTVRIMVGYKHAD